ncbi:DUF1572 family protein [Zeaxanthinibacter sp. PT1]|uniref:DUF1572 family protein n=1 Tax=Zeaxanthinibacter TaxID=561554 RepID=UPI002349DB47|nr:DUF1572 family protein [Zeaxanthinibacter sp. PT1]MDC6350939.1 DUF1572 family protein [Zeaxanthinibacter sp. PT1]
MKIGRQISEHFRQAYFGGNWTDVNLQEQLSDVSWEEANTRIGDLNTIAMLVFHIHYFVKATLQVLQGGKLDAHDKFSFNLPPIKNEEEWESFLQEIWKEGQAFSDAIAGLDDEKIQQTFVEDKYGDYYRNLTGITEHTYYHLGQIVLIKKVLRAS